MTSFCVQSMSSFDIDENAQSRDLMLWSQAPFPPSAPHARWSCHEYKDVSGQSDKHIFTSRAPLVACYAPILCNKTGQAYASVMASFSTIVERPEILIWVPDAMLTDLPAICCHMWYVYGSHRSRDYILTRHKGIWTLSWTCRHHFGTPVRNFASNFLRVSINVMSRIDLQAEVKRLRSKLDVTEHSLKESVESSNRANKRIHQMNDLMRNGWQRRHKHLESPSSPSAPGRQPDSPSMFTHSDEGFKSPNPELGGTDTGDESLSSNSLESVPAALYELVQKELAAVKQVGWLLIRKKSEEFGFPGSLVGSINAQSCGTGRFSFVTRLFEWYTCNFMQMFLQLPPSREMDIFLLLFCIWFHKANYRVLRFSIYCFIIEAERVESGWFLQVWMTL